MENTSIKSRAFNCDCLPAMKEFPDGFFDLAVVDPPYGDGNGEFKRTDKSRFSGNFDKYKPVDRTGRSWSKKYGTAIIEWDKAPTQEYFQELFRISQNIVIWGGNYFSLPPTRCFLIWKKLTISETFSMAMAEYAWTNFNDNAKVFEFAPQGNKEKRFHPTQKPIELYDWIFRLYAKPGMKVLDTHMGSGSSRIAAYNANLDYWGYEISPEYFKLAEERFLNHAAQQNMFLMEGE